MKIESSSISFQSRHVAAELDFRQESLQFWTDDEPNAGDSPPGVIMQISERGKELQKNTGSYKISSPESGEEDFLTAEDKQKIALLEALFEHILGKKFKFILPKGVRFEENAHIRKTDSGSGAGWGLIYYSKSLQYEVEKVSFVTTGMVKTSDGREIKVDLQLNMSREFMAANEIHIRAGDAAKKDPLVINFNAPTAALSDSKFSFDIDCDGIPDQISRLCAGSGFLSLDLNNDGKINDGSELFGPQSGNGFMDLSKYDSDGNGWIDENDPVFDKLRIWIKNENGEDVLFALGEMGIGAICLGSAYTPFSLKGKGNTENGVIQRTGIFLNENGSAGTIQHVDLVV